MERTVIPGIMKPYFDWLTKEFGHFANEARRNNVTAGAIARDYLRDPGRRERFATRYMDHLCDEVLRFWQANGAAVQKELESMPGLKARFGGDIGPQQNENVFERAGLYFDTLVVPDPLLRVARIPNVTKTKDYYLLKYSILQVLFKDIYLADVAPHIAVLIPDNELLPDTVDFGALCNVARVDTVAITNKLYDRKFDAFEDLKAFYAKFKSVEEAAHEVVCPDLFLWDEDVERNPLAQIEEYGRKQEIDMDTTALPDEWQGGSQLLFWLSGRMFQVNDVLGRSSEHGSHPLVSAPVSFHWMSLKIATNQELMSRQLDLDAYVNLGRTNALLSQGLDWLGNVPMEVLIELRRKGRLGDIRAVIDKDLGSLSNVALGDLARVVNQVDHNLSTALELHQEKVQELSSSFKREIGTSATTFAVSVSAALQPSHLSFLPHWAKALGGVIGTSTLKDMVAATGKYLRERKAIGKTPVGILWQAKSKKQK